MDKTIGNIQKNSLEVLRVSLNEYKGSEFLSLRYFYDGSGKGIYVPTRKGITLPIPLLSKLSELIKKAIEEAEMWSRGNEKDG